MVSAGLMTIACNNYDGYVAIENHAACAIVLRRDHFTARTDFNCSSFALEKLMLAENNSPLNM